MSKSKSTRMRPVQAGSGQPGRVRIIAGRWRGRRLPVPDLPEIRPTGDRIRETLFNWLTPIIVGARCLDLFAGSGVLGFESGSRGAAEVVLVDRSRKVTAVLERETNRLNAESMTIVCADAMQWLSQSRERGFDVVFLDPPFNYEGVSEICGRWRRWWPRWWRCADLRTLGGNRHSASGRSHLYRAQPGPLATNFTRQLGDISREESWSGALLSRASRVSDAARSSTNKIDTSLHVARDRHRNLNLKKQFKG